MATTQTKMGWDIERWSMNAAVFAGACNLLCWAIINYLNFVIQIRVFHRDSILMNYPEIISQGLWLSPLLALLAFRRVLVVTSIYAVILFVSLAGCTYDFVRFLLIGTNAIPMLGWPGFLLFVLGMVSLVAALIKVSFRR